MLYTKEIKTKSTYDLVVCGGGLTGFACALSAARKGVKTALIEKHGCLGGVATNALVCHLLGGVYWSNGQLHWNVQGIFQELAEELIRRRAAVNPETIDRDYCPQGWFSNLADALPFEVESMKVLLDELCSNAGVDVYFFTDIIDVLKNKNRIQSVIAHNKSGLFAVESEYFADTTGDADIAMLGGCKTILGRDGDGLMAPASLEMHVEHVDTGVLAQYIYGNGEPRLRKLISQLRERGEWDFPYEIFISVQLNQPDVYMINTIRQVGVHGADGDSLTRAMADGRAETQKLFGLMRKYIPGFANARIKQVAPMIGIRETRRIAGGYTMTVEDVLKGTHFSDSIAVTSYGWDLPDPHRPSHQPLEKGADRASRFTHIPYRCLVPEGIENLITAGRCVSVERDVLGPIRVMALCMAMGQAAGTAAAMVRNNNSSFAGLDVGMLQKTLVRDGCICFAREENGLPVFNEPIV